MAVIGFYIFMGALLFGVWEEWEPLEASYFCFVTISTIGFGDLVPGSANFESTEDQYKMIFSAVYMLFGNNTYTQTYRHCNDVSVIGLCDSCCDYSVTTPLIPSAK